MWYIILNKNMIIWNITLKGGLIIEGLTKKPTYREYKDKWLYEKFNVRSIRREEVYYESVTKKIKNDIEQSSFWVGLIEDLKEFHDEYNVQSGYDLFADSKTPTLLIKSYESLLHKTYRKNIVENANWPKEPNIGWISPDDCYEKINDIIRTLLVVKYLDGVEFLINKIKNHCNSFNCKCDIFHEAKDEGYYAVHLYVTNKYEIPRKDWDTKVIAFRVEVQVSTQIQEVIRKLLHSYYEENRKNIIRDNVAWQWNYKSDEFVANYLGHILHYVEGMIMEVREKQKGGSKKNE